MIFGDPQSFEDALDYLGEKNVLPTTLSSAEIRERLSGAVKRRAAFSARMTQADVLQKMQDLAGKIAGGLTQGGAVAGEGGESDPMVTIAEAKAQLAEALRGLGYQADEEDEGTIKDFLSEQRLQLIVETNVLDAQGYGRWQSAQDETELDVNPAWELVRFVDAEKPRDWEARWASAIEATTTEGATLPGSGRMVALKNHPVWQALGDGAGGYEDTLGNPWPPFAFNSGMNVVDVPREEAIELGLLGESTRVPAVTEDADLNEGLQADAARFEPALRDALAADPALTMRDGVLTVKLGS